MQIGHVSSEGGPLLVGDYCVLKQWNGIENDDYDLLIQNPLEDFPHKIGGRTTIAWDTLGGAVVSVHVKDKGSIVLVRSYEEVAGNDKYVDCPGQDEELIGVITIISETMLVLHATESAALLEPPRRNSAPGPSGALVFEGSALAIPLCNGDYRLTSDYVFGGDGFFCAKRLTVEAVEDCGEGIRCHTE